MPRINRIAARIASPYRFVSLTPDSLKPENVEVVLLGADPDKKVARASVTIRGEGVWLLQASGKPQYRQVPTLLFSDWEGTAFRNSFGIWMPEFNGEYFGVVTAKSNLGTSEFRLDQGQVKLRELVNWEIKMKLNQEHPQAEESFPRVDDGDYLRERAR